MYRYQNVSEQTQSLTANGNINPRIVEADGIVISDVPIENVNFKYLGEEDSAVNATVETPQPNAVLGVETKGGSDA